MAMEPYAWLALAPIAGLAADCAAHILLVRLTRGVQKKRYACILAAMAVGLAATAAVSVAALSAMGAPTGDFAAFLLMNAAACVGLGYGYLNFVNLNLTSLRIRILHEMLAAGGKIPKAALKAKYNMDQVVRLRIERLVAGGHFVEREGRFHRGKDTLLYIAGAVSLMRALVFGRRNRRLPAREA